MIGVFAVALIRKSPAVGPLNDIVACLGAVPAAGLAAHVIILQVPPSLLEIGTPEVLSADTGITPREIIMMEAVVFIGGHPISDIRIRIQFLP